MSISSIIELWDSVLYSLYNIVVRISFITSFFKIKKCLSGNKEYKNKYKGQRCFIVLNGPSINSHDLTPLEKEYVFASNYFYRAPLAQVVNPNFYCWLDAKIFSEDCAPIIIKDILKLCPNADLLLNYKAYNVIKKHERVHYVCTKHIPNMFVLKNNLAGVCSNFTSVAFFAMAAAIYMGFSKIYVLGLDFEPGGFKHFVNLGEDAECERSEDKASKDEVCGLHWGYAKAQYESFYISKYAQKRGAEIVNLNPESCIRSFPFSKFEKII